jgi:molybdenum cofactor cytidylyltransferase
MQRVAAVILAAGESRRFGPDNKLLAEVGGAPLVRRVVDAVQQCGISEIVVVTGHDRLAVEKALDDLPVHFQYNSNWERGMGTSIAAGVSALGVDVDGAFIVPGDMALLSPNLICKLIDVFEEDNGGLIAVPVTARWEQRNPVLWPRSYFSKLASLDGAEGAKKLLAEFGTSCRRLTISDELLFGDVDTPDDLAVARARIAGDQR